MVCCDSDINSPKFIVTVPVRFPDEKGFFTEGSGLIHMQHRSNYDWVLLLTSSMAFTGV